MMSSASPSEGLEHSNNVPPPSRRRDKAQLSCNLCRRRKLKCDRGLPCETCARRGLSMSCTYPVSTPLQSGKRVIDPSSTIMHKRISQLEKLVLSMSNQPAQAATPAATPAAVEKTKAPSPTDQANELSQLHKSFGRISLENTETNYVEGSHWTAILDGIAELKDYFDDGREAPQPQKNDDLKPPTPGPILLLSEFPRLNRQQILASIPPKLEVDRLVSKFFNTTTVYTISIHGPTFLEEYDCFWKCPEKTPTMWIGLLFCIMCLACIYQGASTAWDYSSNSADAIRQAQAHIQQRSRIYRERVVQCLTLADYTKCGAYTVEVLIFYLSIEYANATDNQTGLWLLLGIIIRTGVRMGYHRDGSHSPRLSPFEVEMRRRIWATLYMLDSASADQYGLPRMINQSLADTREPLSLKDEDISPDMEKLPPARPDSETTIIGFLALKNRLLSTQNLITDLTSYPNKSVSYKEILKLDNIIHEQFQSIPPPLRMRPIHKALTDSTGVIANRIFLALISYVSRCLLHRDYLLAARTDDRYRYSRKACIETALEILNIQESIREECQIGRRLYQEHWKFQLSVKHIFLLATTILCVDVNRDLGEAPSKRKLGKELFSKIVNALRVCYDIWLESSDASRESEKAAEMLRVVLGKVHLSGRMKDHLSSMDTFWEYDEMTSTRMLDPSLLTTDHTIQSSWGNHADVSDPFDVPNPDTVLNNTNKNEFQDTDWNFDVSMTNQAIMNDITMRCDWWAAFDPSTMN